MNCTSCFSPLLKPHPTLVAMLICSACHHIQPGTLEPAPAAPAGESVEKPLQLEGVVSPEARELTGEEKLWLAIDKHGLMMDDVLARIQRLEAAVLPPPAPRLAAVQEPVPAEAPRAPQPTAVLEVQEKELRAIATEGTVEILNELRGMRAELSSLHEIKDLFALVIGWAFPDKLKKPPAAAPGGAEEERPAPEQAPTAEPVKPPAEPTVATENAAGAAPEKKDEEGEKPVNS